VDEFSLTFNQVVDLLVQALAVAQNPARSAAILAHTNSILANPIAPTPFGQLVIYVTRLETLKFIMETPLNVGPDIVL
jgi:hypothetical protein